MSTASVVSASRRRRSVWRRVGDARYHTCAAVFAVWTWTVALAPAMNADERERGDVPGWVMITLMSAVLVAALLAIAGPALEGLFNQAIAQVSQ